MGCFRFRPCRLKLFSSWLGQESRAITWLLRLTQHTHCGQVLRSMTCVNGNLEESGMPHVPIADNIDICISAGRHQGDPTQAKIEERKCRWAKDWPGCFGCLSACGVGCAPCKGTAAGGAMTQHVSPSLSYIRRRFRSPSCFGWLWWSWRMPVRKQLLRCAVCCTAPCCASDLSGGSTRADCEESVNN